MESKQSAYAPPLDQLLKLGDNGLELRKWLDYRELGIGEEHVPELIRMAVDPDFRWAPSESRKVWAPVHAWHALGELRAVAAIDTLLPLFDEVDDDDWVGEELPKVFGLIGPTALLALTAFLSDQSRREFARIGASESIRYIAYLHPQAASRCVEILFRQLMRFEKQPSTLNAFLILWLVDLGFTRAESLIKLAFSFGAVDESLMGGYEDVYHDMFEMDPLKREEYRQQVEEEMANLRQYLTD